MPSVPFQTAWLAALLYLCFSLRKRSSKGHLGLMAGLVCHKFGGKTGQLIARTARVIENGESFDGVSNRMQNSHCVGLAVAITMPSIRIPGPPARNCRRLAARNQSRYFGERNSTAAAIVFTYSTAKEAPLALSNHFLPQSRNLRGQAFTATASVCGPPPADHSFRFLRGNTLYHCGIAFVGCSSLIWLRVVSF